MTLSTTTNRVTYTGNGVTVAFSFPYAFFAQADLVVVETIIATGVQTVKTLTTHYTISGSVDALGHYSSGGTVTANTAPASTVTWTIYRDPTATQTTDLVENDPMPAESLEAALDYQTMLNQRTRDIAARSLQQPEGDSATIDRLPSKVDRASMYLGFDADGDPIALAAPATTTAVSAFMATALDDTTAAAARTTLGLDVAAKGDLFAATANDTLATLTVGTTTGHALVVDPSASTGLSYSHRSQPNPIINGNMEIWQRGTTFAAAAHLSYSADRWRWEKSGGGAVTINRSTNVPTVAEAGVLFNYSLEVDVTAAEASIGEWTFYYLKHNIEGYNWRHFAQRQVTLSFWVRSTQTGTYSVAFQNTGADRYFIAEYTINVSDTWEYKTITVAASPSAGSWNYVNGVGVQISFTVAGGSSYASSTLNAWTTGEYVWSTNQVNGVDDTANVFRITGVKLELGSVATPIQYVPFEEELARCQRYYQKSFNYATAPAQNVGLGLGEYRWLATTAGAVATMGPTWPLSPNMRPGGPGLYMTWFNPSAANAQARNLTNGADMTATATRIATEKSAQLQFTGAAGNAVGNELAIHWAADAELYWAAGAGL